MLPASTATVPAATVGNVSGMAIATHKSAAAARRPIEAARRETNRAVAYARTHGHPALAKELERISEQLREAKGKVARS